MPNRKYPEEFRAEAIKQVTKRGYKVREISDCALGPGIAVRQRGLDEVLQGP